MSDEPFDFNKWFAEASEQVRANWYEGEVSFLRPPAYDPPSPENLTANKVSALFSVPVELLVDFGAMTEEEARTRGWQPTVYSPVPWWRRLRYRIWQWRDAAALKLYRLVAGHDPEPSDDY